LLSLTSFPPIGGCLVTNFSLSLSLSLYVIAADGNINDKVVEAIKTKGHKLDIALLVACGRRHLHLVVDAHRVDCVAGQLRQDIDDMIVASGGSRVLLASQHVIALRMKRKLARAHRPSHSMRLKHRDRRASGSARAHPKVYSRKRDRMFII